jgi:hypothetical protein
MTMDLYLMDRDLEVEIWAQILEAKTGNPRKEMEHKVVNLLMI